MPARTLLSTVPASLARVKNPQDTGENRCLPCTVTNAAIGATAGALAWWLVDPLVGLGVGAVTLAAIWARGSLVPGTPALTRRYFPDRVLRWFDEAPVADFDLESFDIVETLADAGVLYDDPEEPDLVLDRRFAEDWATHTSVVLRGSDDRRELAEVFGVDPRFLRLVEREDGAFVAYVRNEWIGTWESRPAFAADMAAARVLAETYPAWPTLPVAAQSETVGAIRLFLEECPDCGGRVTLGTAVVQACCRDVDVVATTCSVCGARIFESEVDLGAVGAPA